MGLKLITAPPAEPLTLAEAYRQCQIDTTGSPVTSAFDDWLTEKIPVVRSQVEKEIGRALILQTWELWLDEFPQMLLDDYRDTSRYPKVRDWRAIEIPLPPLQSITSITYIDTNGDSQTLTTDDYILDDSVEPAQLLPAVNTCWPSTQCRPGAVKIRFVAGYTPTYTGSPPTVSDYAANVPAPIKHWMLLLLANWFRNREATWQSINVQTVLASPYVDDLIFPYRVLGHAV